MSISAAREKKTERGGRREAPTDVAAWPRVPLREVCHQDRRIVEPGSREAGELPYLSLEHVEPQTGRILKQTATAVEDEGKSTTFRFDARHVLYGKLRPYLNKVALPDFAGRCTTEMIPLLPGDGIRRDFLAWLLRREETVAFALEQNTGSRMPRADMDSLLALSIPLPPLAEQERIAGRLTEQLGAVERARAAAAQRLAAAEALPAAYLREVFEGLIDLPYKRLGDICRDISDGTHFTPDYIASGIPFLSVKDVKTNGIRFDDCRYVSEEQHRALCRRCKPERGDVLYTKVGTTGIAKAIDVDREFSIFVSVALLKLGPELDPSYVEYALNGPACRAQAELLTQGMANRNLVLRDIREIVLPVPPLPDQRRIAESLSRRLAAAERLAASIREELAAIEALPASLLREAFGGSEGHE